MAIDTTVLLEAVKDSIKSESRAAFQATFDALVPPIAPPVKLTLDQFQSLADALAPAIVLVAQHIKDNADVTGITTGGGTSVGGVN